jgi:DNA-binding beta-propeller fold protein YncE
VVATVPLGKRPRGIRLSPDRTTLYVALSGSPFAPPGVDEKSLPPPDRSADGIGVVDVRAMKLVKTIPAGTDPEQLAVSKDGRRLFIANEDAATASVPTSPAAGWSRRAVGGDGGRGGPAGRRGRVRHVEGRPVFAIGFRRPSAGSDRPPARHRLRPSSRA